MAHGRLLLWLVMLTASLCGQVQPDYATCESLFNESKRPAEALRELVTEHPGSAWAHHFLALALAEQGQLSAAQAELRVAIAKDPQQAWHHKALAENFEQRLMPTEARAALAEALRLEARPEVRKALEVQLAHLATKVERLEGQGDDSLRVAPILLALGGFLGLSFLIHRALRSTER